MAGALILHGLLIGGMSILYITTYTFPVVTIGGTLGPTFWPRTMALLGIVLTLVSAYQTVRGRKGSEPMAAGVGGDSERAEGAEEPPLAMSRFWMAVVAFAVFVVLLTATGFATAAGLLAGFYVWLIGLRSKAWTVVTAILIGLGFAVLFGRVLQVALPRGLGVLRELSYYLY